MGTKTCWADETGRRTILQSATARWALRLLSVLSLRGAARSGALPIWKIFPADLGRFLRPFDAELMHTQPLSKQPEHRTIRRLYSPSPTPPLGSASCLSAPLAPSPHLLPSSPRLLNSPPPTTGRLETRLVSLCCPCASRASPLVWQPELSCSPTSLRAQAKKRMSACDAAPHRLDLHSGSCAEACTPRAGPRPAELAPLTHPVGRRPEHSPMLSMCHHFLRLRVSMKRRADGR